MSLYDASVPTLLQGLTTLQSILTTAQSNATTRTIPTADFAAARLIADQLPLTFQVHNATRTAKAVVERLTGAPQTPYDSDLKSADFDQLLARIEDAKGLLKGVKKEDVEKRSAEKINVPVGKDKSEELTVQNSVLRQSVPNFFFHLVTAFSILRAHGVPIGKGDYITPFITAQQ